MRDVVKIERDLSNSIYNTLIPGVNSVGPSCTFGLSRVTNARESGRRRNGAGSRQIMVGECQTVSASTVRHECRLSIFANSRFREPASERKKDL